MAIPHASPGEAIDIRPLGVRLPQERTTALFKSDDLELIHLVLQAGKSFPPHQVAGGITIQCIEGRLDVTMSGQNCILESGQVLYLPGSVLHGVMALEDSSALVTIVLRS